MKQIEDFFFNPMKEKAPTKKQIKSGLQAIIKSNKEFKQGKKKIYTIDI